MVDSTISAYCEGWQAYLLGDSCPYCLDSDNWAQWVEGYYDCAEYSQVED